MSERPLSQPKGAVTVERGKVVHPLEAQEATHQRRWQPSPEENKKILKARAKELAKENGRCLDVKRFRS